MIQSMLAGFMLGKGMLGRGSSNAGSMLFVYEYVLLCLSMSRYSCKHKQMQIHAHV